MNRSNDISPIDRDVATSIRKDPEYAAAYFEALFEEPLPVQLALLRKLQGVTQEKMALRLRLKQAQISRLERRDTDHLVSTYEKAAKLLKGRLAIIPAGAKVVPA